MTAAAIVAPVLIMAAGRDGAIMMAVAAAIVAPVLIMAAGRGGAMMMAVAAAIVAPVLIMAAGRDGAMIVAGALQTTMPTVKKDRSARTATLLTVKGSLGKTSTGRRARAAGKGMAMTDAVMPSIAATGMMAIGATCDAMQWMMTGVTPKAGTHHLGARPKRDAHLACMMKTSRMPLRHAAHQAMTGALNITLDCAKRYLACWGARSALGAGFATSVHSELHPYMGMYRLIPYTGEGQLHHCGPGLHLIRTLQSQSLSCSASTATAYANPSRALPLTSLPNAQMTRKRHGDSQDSLC